MRKQISHTHSLKFKKPLYIYFLEFGSDFSIFGCQTIGTIRASSSFLFIKPLHHTFNLYQPSPSSTLHRRRLPVIQCLRPAAGHPFKIINFLDQVNLLRKSFTYYKHSLITLKDVKFAFKLAREAINSQINKVESTQEKLENCVICLDDKSIDQFFSIEGCTHRYCCSCVKQHVEVKLLNGVLPKCPHEGCGNELRIESCEKFLNPKFTEMMRQRLKEDSIPVTEKVYCPYPKCSTFVTTRTFVRCYSIHSLRLAPEIRIIM
ncbi:putative transcription factor C2H2 family [Helianthus anomalus]